MNLRKSSGYRNKENGLKIKQKLPNNYYCTADFENAGYYFFFGGQTTQFEGAKTFLTLKFLVVDFTQFLIIKLWIRVWNPDPQLEKMLDPDPYPDPH